MADIARADGEQPSLLLLSRRRVAPPAGAHGSLWCIRAAVLTLCVALLLLVCALCSATGESERSFAEARLATSWWQQHATGARALFWARVLQVTTLPFASTSTSGRALHELFGNRRGRSKWKGWTNRAGFPPSASDNGVLDKEPVIHLNLPQGAALAIECTGGTHVREVSYAMWGTPIIHVNGSASPDPACDSQDSLEAVRAACQGQSHCCLPIADQNLGRDPCPGKVKSIAIELRGCLQHQPESRYKIHCSLQGHPLIVDEDIEFLAALQLPAAAEPVGPWVAAMVDTSYRPALQHYVVHNVHNMTGWPIQIFTGPTNKQRLEVLFQDLIHRQQLTLTNIGDDYMEDWKRLSSMMLLPTFWRATLGRKVLIFQPDSIMCSKSPFHIRDFLQYDYVGPPMAGAYWATTDHPSQWGVGCGGFSLRDRALSLRMVASPGCITPAAGRLEDQQLGTMWRNVEKRCAREGIYVKKPDRFEAVKFGVEYDLYMDILPGEQPKGYPIYPDGCTADYIAMKKRQRDKQWRPQPRPSTTPCVSDKGEKYGPFFIPMGCHKCWTWNPRTWGFMREHCFEAVTMRKLRRSYGIGVEFTGFPTRPKIAPRKGAVTPDERYQPIDMLTGKCIGSCQTMPPPKVEHSVLGKYEGLRGRGATESRP